MQKAYRYSVVYFLVFSLLLVISGAMLFEHKIGFSIESVNNYYLGNSEKYTSPKTLDAVLKTLLPHIFSFALFVMVILHFLVFTKLRESFTIKVLIYLTFTTAFLEMTTPFLIIYFHEVFAYAKIVSFVLFESLIIYIGYLLFSSIMND